MRALRLAETGELRRRIERLRSLLSPCTLCPRECKVDRLRGEVGFCGITRARVASYGPHFGEESCLVGRGGSGTIFMSGCNLNCLFCQNYRISHGCEGLTVDPVDISTMMLELRKRGCENINWVTPTHMVPYLVAALEIAIEGGLEAPIVYNCGGYESPVVLGLLEDIVDIYLPDVKFASREWALKLARTADYYAVASRSLRTMYSQVGGLRVDREGVAMKGVLVRHLVLPNGLSGTRRWAGDLPSLIGINGAVNVMNQYRPMYHAASIPELNRRITAHEFRDACDACIEQGLNIVD